MIELEVRAGQRPYAFRAGPGLLEDLGPSLRAAGVEGRIVLVADSSVLARWGRGPLGSLEDSSYRTLVLEVPPGERSKSLETAGELYGRMIDAGIDRGDAVVSLGGGVVGDLAGFVAATYHRGLPFVQLPTTLLAQVDSSVGGKVAVDHPKGKNLVGAFHQPRLVLADTSVLSTLSARDRWSGLAEVVKAALIADEDFLAFLERHLEALASGEPELLEQAIARAVAIKAAIVEEDEREADRRRLLNFGHTIGHALELAAGFEHLTHGEAVVAGMRGAVAVSRALGSLTDDDAERAIGLLSRFPATPSFPLPPREELIAAVKRDKKAKAGAVRFVVLSGLGRAEVVPDLSPSLLSLAIEASLES